MFFPLILSKKITQKPYQICLYPLMRKRFTLFLFVALALGPSREAYAQTVPTPTQTDEIIIDNGASGKADPSDRIRYKVTIQNTGASNANGAQLTINPDPRTTFLPGTFRSSPLALPDAYACTGNVGINVSAANGLLVNDFDDNIGGLTITAGTFATTGGGTIMIAADGSFMYTPPPGLTGGATDTYAYTLNDGNPVGLPVPLTDMGTVTFTLNNLIWFIDNSSMAATSDGRLTSPFKTLADFNAGSAAAGEVIYLEETGTNYTGGIVLQNNERLFGEGHTGAANLANVLPFSLAPNSKALPSINGLRPVITNLSGDGVTLAMNNNLRGFDIGACTGLGMENNGMSSVGDLIVSEVAINNTSGGGFVASNGSNTMNAVFTSISTIGGTDGIRLSSCSGIFTVNGGTISNPTVSGVKITGSSVVFTYSGSISKVSGYVIEITGSSNVTFQTGDITSAQGTGISVTFCPINSVINFNNPSYYISSGTSTAVNISSNLGTINFTNGGLGITTTSGTGFHADNGGTINVTGMGNSIVTASGIGLNIQNVNAGANGIAFNSITCSSGQVANIVNSAGIKTLGRVNTTSAITALNLDNAGSVDIGHVSIPSSLNTSSFTGITIKNTNLNLTGLGVAITTTSGKGVDMTGGIVNITGGKLVITTTSGTGFNATGGGTVTVQGTGNTINSTSATALNVTSTTIGASGVTFQSISSGNNTAAADPVNGIVLNTTSSSGGLSVTGTGSANTGGTIQNMTGVGISLTSTASPTFNYINVSGTGDHAFSGSLVSNLSISNSTINNAGNATNEHGISFNQNGMANLTGTFTLNNVSMTAFHAQAVSIWNYSGSLTLNISDSDFNDNHDVNGTNALDIRALTAANMNVNVTSNAFDNIEGSAFAFVADGSGGHDINVISNTSTNSGGPDNFPTQAVFSLNIQSPTLSTFDFKSNNLQSVAGEGIIVVGEGNLMGRVGGDNVADGNTIVIDGVGDAMRFDFDGLLATSDGNYIWTILAKNNTMTLSNTSDDGIQILNRDHTGTLNLTIESNTISGPVSEGIRSFDADRSGAVQVGPFANYKFANNTFTNIGAAETIYVISDDQASVCAHITGNGGNGTGAGKNFTLERRVTTATLQITQASTAALSTANNNVTVNVNVQPVTFNGACTNPPLPTN